MSDQNDFLYGEAQRTIDELFGDTSVPIQTTIDKLESLMDHIDLCIGAMKEDLRNG